jgi:hypothetical protein
MSKPLIKDFTKELLLRVKLDFWSNHKWAYINHSPPQILQYPHLV